MGCFEMTIGSQALAASTGPQLEKLLAVSGVLAWSGLSIQAQVMSLVSDTPIRYWFYIKARLLQILFSLGFTLIGFKLCSASVPLLTNTSPLYPSMPTALDFLQSNCQASLWCLAVLLVIGLLTWLGSIRFTRSVH